MCSTKKIIIYCIWNLFNTTGIETQWYLITTNSQQHIIDLRTSYRFPKAFPLRIEADVFLYTGKNDRELDFNNNYNSRYSTYVELSYPVENQKVNASLYIGGVFALMEVRIYTEQIKAKILIVNTGFRHERYFGVKLQATSFCNCDVESRQQNC
jgi:hypothetical protein